MSLMMSRSIPRLAGAVSQPSRRIFTGITHKNTFTATDAVVEKPHQSKLTNYVCVTAAVVLGVTAGAWMSKNIASFLEENELFVPSDDDDDF